MRPRDLKSHVFPSQPRTLNDRQILSRNKAENRCYATSIATDCNYSKKDPNENFNLRVSTDTLRLLVR